MIRNIALSVLVIIISFGLGGWSVWALLNSDWRPGSLTIGDWTAYPGSGTPDADPYTKARIARHAELPLGAAEGLSFIATRDSKGEFLTGDCTFRIEGKLPPSRLWTIFIADTKFRPIITKSKLPLALHSRQVIYNDDGSISFTISREVAPLNWISPLTDERFSVVMTFYDSALLNNIETRDLTMPQILRGPCNE